MKARNAVIQNNSTASLVILAVIFGIFAIATETVFHLPVKLPGHRAFPGALALLIFASTFAPMMLIGFAAAVSAILVIATGASPMILGIWIVAAIGIWALSRTRLNQTLLFFFLGGLLFGGLRYLALMKGFHHTPEIIRVGGHLGFGSLAGLISFGAFHLTTYKR